MRLSMRLPIAMVSSAASALLAQEPLATPSAHSAETVEISAYSFDVAGGTAYVSSFALPRLVPYCSTILPGYTEDFERAFVAWKEEFKVTIDHGRMVMERDGKGRSAEAQIRDLEPEFELRHIELQRLPVKKGLDTCQFFMKYLTTPNPLKGKVIKIK